MQNLHSITNIIFDFGGVLLNINPNQAVKSFQEIGLYDVEYIKREYQEEGLFDRFEKGVINPEDFRNNLRRHIKQEVSDEQIDEAWNSMLLDLPVERLKLLLELAKNYKLYLLSNTNIIHWEAYTKQIKETYGVELSEFFEKAYFSHDMKLRKPDVRIYQEVLNQENLKAEETLFIDDMAVNVEAAESLGIKGHFLDLENGETVLDVFKALSISC